MPRNSTHNLAKSLKIALKMVVAEDSQENTLEKSPTKDAFRGGGGGGVTTRHCRKKKKQICISIG